MTSSARPEGPPAPAAHPGVGRHALLVAAGIFLSRITGLVRDRIFAHYFGITYVADAFKAALRIPNMLQNLFGEGVLSASFIPVYAKLLAQKDREEAGRVAGAVFSLLAIITSVLVLVGVLATPYIIDVIAFGFKGETRRLAIQLVRILFPGVGLLVMSAWCLGILNSHGKFFLSYVSPVIVNAVFIAVMLAFGRRADMSHLAVYTAWGSVVGSGLQFLMQLPMVLRLAPELRILFRSLTENVRVVIRNFVPVFFSRGVLQLSAYIDGLLASLLPVGGVSALANAQALYLLPVSLFGMSVSAAELPAMSSAVGTDEQVAMTLRQRIAASTKRVGFFVVPSAVGFIALGDVITATIYQTGKFSHADAVKVWTILAGSGVGLVASTVGRLYSSAYYALRDTRTPVRFAIVRVILTTVLGYFCSRPLPRLLGVDPFWGAAGLTASAGFAAWVEFTLLRRGMNLKIGRTEFPKPYFAKLWVAAVIAAAVAWGVKLGLPQLKPWIAGVLILAPYGAVYLGCTVLMGIEQASGLMRRMLRKG
ncbi:MAG TPA: murein biosynthesis integral membrane protein MurJ [Candidatus Acidoferrales bacterium]|nr:murein biosynthesis integral membrane protein MurJ [Candidatus Acidoferrales bacterium]